MHDWLISNNLEKIVIHKNKKSPVMFRVFLVFLRSGNWNRKNISFKKKKRKFSTMMQSFPWSGEITEVKP